jgi:hypothetical protein
MKTELKGADFLRGYLIDLNLCDEIEKLAISEKDNSQEGKCGSKEFIVNKKIKESNDLFLDNYPILFDSYMDELQKCLDCYMDEYKFCASYGKFTITTATNIQRYEPKQGFHSWHTERNGAADAVRDRHLVFMTYLNDVSDRGETEWFHQKLKVKPKKGLTVIWPADWTFTHRGISSPTQRKIIVTGWFSYVQRN